MVYFINIYSFIDFHHAPKMKKENQNFKIGRKLGRELDSDTSDAFGHIWNRIKTCVHHSPNPKTFASHTSSTPKYILPEDGQLGNSPEGVGLVQRKWLEEPPDKKQQKYAEEHERKQSTPTQRCLFKIQGQKWEKQKEPGDHLPAQLPVAQMLGRPQPSRVPPSLL